MDPSSRCSALPPTLSRLFFTPCPRPIETCHTNKHPLIPQFKDNPHSLARPRYTFRPRPRSRFSILDSRFSILLVLIFIFAQLRCYLIPGVEAGFQSLMVFGYVSSPSSRPRMEMVGSLGPCSILWLPILIRFITSVSVVSLHSFVRV